MFGEYQPYVFDFGNALAGKYFQMVIRKTSEQAGYASYQIYPRDANGAPFDPIPEPASLVVLLGGIHLVLKRRRRFPGLWRFNRLRQSNR